MFAFCNFKLPIYYFIRYSSKLALKPRSSLLLLALCLSFSLAPRAEDNRVSFTQDEAPWPMYSCITDDEWSCILSDMFRAATDAIGADPIFKHYPESRMVPETVKKNADVTTVYVSPYLPQEIYPDSLTICPQLLFTTPYVVFRKRDDPITIKQDIDLHNYRVGIVRKGEPQRYKIRGETLRKLTLYNKEPSMVKGLLSNRVDLILMSEMGGIPSLNGLGALDKVEAIYNLYEYSFYFSYAKTAPEDKPILNKLCPALVKLESSGKLQEIENRYRNILNEMLNGNCPLNQCLNSRHKKFTE